MAMVMLNIQTTLLSREIPVYTKIDPTDFHAAMHRLANDFEFEGH
jgi:hypothetical protein